MADKKKRGLGRGLDALLDPLVADEVIVTENNSKKEENGVLTVSVYDIDTYSDQPRKTFDSDKLQELADSISVHGVIQPLIVRKEGERYRIVAGERRFRAAKLAKLETVPVIVVDYDDRRLQEISLIENIQREDLNPVEEASAIRFLMKQHDMTQEEVSARLGRSRPAVANSLRLLSLPDSVLETVRSGELSAGHGRAIAGVNDEKLQEKLKNECLRLGYSVRALESRIRNLNEKHAGEKKRSVKEKLSPELRDFEKKLHELFKTKVRIEGSENKGKITIEYYSQQELETIYELLNRD